MVKNEKSKLGVEKWIEIRQNHSDERVKCVVSTKNYLNHRKHLLKG